MEKQKKQGKEQGDTTKHVNNVQEAKTELFVLPSKMLMRHRKQTHSHHHKGANYKTRETGVKVHLPGG